MTSLTLGVWWNTPKLCDHVNYLKRDASVSERGHLSTLLQDMQT